MVIKLDSPANQDIIKQIEKVFIEEDPGSPHSLNLLNETLRSSYDEERNLNTIFFVLSILAILISGLGLFGLATYSSQSRKKEIGVRKVNGAMIRDILTRFSKELLIWIALAIIIASPLAILIMNNWLTNFEYKTGISYWIIITAGIVTLAIGLISVVLATYREASRNPAETLRFE
jgi:putative ABC transport system permease protein